MSKQSTTLQPDIGEKWHAMIPEWVEPGHARHALLLKLLPGEPLHPGEYRRPCYVRGYGGLRRIHIYYSTQSTYTRPIVAAYDGDVLCSSAVLFELLGFLQRQYMPRPATFSEHIMRPLCAGRGVGDGGEYWGIRRQYTIFPLVYEVESRQVLSWHHAGNVTRQEVDVLTAAMRGRA